MFFDFGGGGGIDFRGVLGEVVMLDLRLTLLLWGL